MNWVDFLILTLLFGGFFWSFSRGFIMEIIYFAASLGGLLSGFVFYPSVKSLIQVIVPDPSTAGTIGFVILFIFGASVIAFLGMLIHKFIYMIHLGIFDRLLGGLFGMVKVAMIISVALVMFIGTTGEQTPDYLENSVISQPIIEVSTAVIEGAPSLFETFNDDYGEDAVKWLRKKRHQVQ